MGIDAVELKKRGQASQGKPLKHPYAAIEHRVLDSAAFADLTYSARTLLLLIARQLTKDNNGHLQATFSYMRRYGLNSEHTLSRSIKELIAHGFIYRTRSGGYQQGAAQYAVTWLSIKNRNGLFLAGFKPFGWRDWKSGEEKSPPANKLQSSGKNGIPTAVAIAEYAVGNPLKSADNELVPCSCDEMPPVIGLQSRKKTNPPVELYGGARCSNVRSSASG